MSETQIIGVLREQEAGNLRGGGLPAVGHQRPDFCRYVIISVGDGGALSTPVGFA